MIARSCSIASLFFFKISLFSGEKQPGTLGPRSLMGSRFAPADAHCQRKSCLSGFSSAADAVALLESKAKMIAFTILTRKIAVVQLNRAPSVR